MERVALLQGNPFCFVKLFRRLNVTRYELINTVSLGLSKAIAKINPIGIFAVQNRPFLGCCSSVVRSFLASPSGAPEANPNKGRRGREGEAKKLA